MKDSGFGGGIFEEIFGDLGFDISGSTGSRQRQRGKRGRDLQIEVDITLEEAYSGAQKPITVPRYEACSTCQGSGAKPGSKKIPAASVKAKAR